MLLSFPKVALLVASLAAFGQAAEGTRESKECQFYKGKDGEDPPFAASTMVGLGGPGGMGDWDCASRWHEGDTIIGVEGWATEFAVEGIKFHYASGEETPWYGRKYENDNGHASMKMRKDKTTWGAGEAVDIKINGNRKQMKDKEQSNGIGKIEFFVNGQSIWAVWATGKGAIQSDALEVPNGAGILLGVKARGVDWVESLDFKFLKSKVVSTTLVDMKLDEDLKDWNARNQGLERIDLKDTFFLNPNKPGGSNVTYKFSNKESRTKSHSVADMKSHSITAGVTFTVNAEFGVPLITKASVQTAWNFGYTFEMQKTTTNSESTATDLSYDIASPGASNFLEPGKAVHCSAWAISGTYESDYTGTLVTKLEDGTKFSYLTKGHASSVSYGTSVAQCPEVDIKDIPSTAEVGETESAKSKRAVAFQG
ncbi:unnamed protein product [Periconia digitata]|uniref:Uncharacterized protein n=1 Tax=Periconia digitata TaxID=1303443 RepID=A0A9W4XKZ7_9PLEO|nr:unnamed protein product [Periconia digitata]